MKSERRHELEKNQLADWLADFLKKVKPYQNLTLVVVILVAAIIAGYSWSVRRTAAATAGGWDRFYEAFAETQPDPKKFDQISKQYPNTYLAHWSAAIAGDLYLSNGCGNLFLNKADANEALRQASDRYRDVLDGCRQPMLKARATFGLARTFEAQGDLKKAIGRYEEVVNSWPNGTYKPLAERRLEGLQRPAVKKWYDKFEEFDPQKALASTPGIPGERPPFDSGTLREPGSEGSLFSPRFDFGTKKRTDEEPGLKVPFLDPGAEDAEEDDDKPPSTPPEDDAGKSSAETPETPATEPKDEPSPDTADSPTSGGKKDDTPPDTKDDAAPKAPSDAPAKDTPAEKSE